MKRSEVRVEFTRHDVEQLIREILTLADDNFAQMLLLPLIAFEVLYRDMADEVFKDTPETRQQLFDAAKRAQELLAERQLDS